MVRIHKDGGHKQCSKTVKLIFKSPTVDFLKIENQNFDRTKILQPNLNKAPLLIYLPNSHNKKDMFSMGGGETPRKKEKKKNVF